VAKAGNILSQQLDFIVEKTAWSRGQWRQAREYDTVDQGAMLFFFYRESPRWLILGALDGGAMYCLTPLLTTPCYFA
jgi:hypothetical protein